MLRKVVYTLVVGSFFVGMAGMSMAAEKSMAANGSANQQFEYNSATMLRGPVRLVDETGGGGTWISRFRR